MPNLNKLSKKGLSSTVAVVLTILISMTLAITFGLVITGSFIINLGPQLSCTELGISRPISASSACYDSANKELKVVLERNFDVSNVYDINFKLDTQEVSNEKSWTCGLSCGACKVLRQGERTTYYLSLSEFEEGSSIILSANSCALEAIKIASCE